MVANRVSAILPPPGSRIEVEPTTPVDEQSTNSDDRQRRAVLGSSDDH
jgi:hypothetical protein